MGCPTEDERDAEFAKLYKLPEITIFNDELLCNSDFLNGLDDSVGCTKIIE